MTIGEGGNGLLLVPEQRSDRPGGGRAPSMNQTPRRSTFTVPRSHWRNDQCSGGGQAAAPCRVSGACSGPLAQGPGRRCCCAAPLGDRGGIPILPALRSVQDG